MAAPRCPTCRRDVLPREQNKSFPFCSARCREVDLGKWFGGEFRIAGASADEDEDGDALPTSSTTDDAEEDLN
jgi:endogenous inhibitor of DNA gyrase (YacG/DUF329 family)